MNDITHTAATRAHFDRLSETWHEHYGPDGDMQSRVARFADPLHSRVAKGSPVLDFGCGSGHVARRLAAAGWRMTGCDISPRMLEQARSAPDADTVRWTELPSDPALPLPFMAGSFAAVIASSVFEYLAAPAAVLSELARILRPGGWLILTVPDLRHPKRRKEAPKVLLARCRFTRALLLPTRWGTEIEQLRASINRHPLAWWTEQLAVAGLTPEPAGPCTHPLALLCAQKP